MAKHQRQRFTERRRLAQLRAQQACRDKRIKITEEIKALARKEVGKISKRELWLIGSALYWAEGTKQKEWNVSQCVQFGNTDPNVIRIYLVWLMKVCKIPIKNIKFEIYIHRTADAEKAKVYWSKITGFSLNNFQAIIWKKHKVKTKRNINKNYYGLLKIRLLKSTNFNRTITGWTEGIYRGI